MKTEMLLQSSFRLILMLLLVVNSVDAQISNDLEGWSAVELNLKATKKLSFSVAEHLRFRNDISTVKNYFTQIKVNYEILKNLELGAGVRYITKNDDVGGQQGYDPFFRYQFDAAYRHKIEKLGLFFRLRYQNKNQLGRSESEGDVAKEFIRTRFGVGYKIKPLKLTLRLFAEHFNQPNNSKIEQSETRMRYTLKLNRRFKKIGAFTLFYGIQNNSVGDLKTKKSFLGLKYAYKIDFTK
ncbi:conserved hypothetical protein (DUF2490) [Formosa sp. Hel3_A1_48]|uniref:DUF2490 domain-containing protein n=1 Tax=Formosa sp. Hel3_A1_48 TaxID=1336795 RepID=UPI00084E2289|nr:DUF2490 domain-containing protein [Formosa sp. Hel3_A1_48]AOR26233.1 conserved hypothetical protein (DUF2490) [Formosa sp. Hel3_A1_48]